MSENDDPTPEALAKEIWQRRDQGKTGIALWEAERLARAVLDWHSVFGHLSSDPDTAGNLINEKHDTLRAEVERLEERLTTELARNRQLQDRNDALELSRNAEVERLKVERTKLQGENERLKTSMAAELGRLVDTAVAEQLKAERAKVERLRGALLSLCEWDSGYDGVQHNTALARVITDARAALGETGDALTKEDTNARTETGS